MPSLLSIMQLSQTGWRLQRQVTLPAMLVCARTITDARALRVIVIACIVLHAASGLLEVYAFAQGLSGAIWGNVALRALAVALFAYYGFMGRPAAS